MIVAFMKPLSGGKKNGSTIPITMSARPAPGSTTAAAAAAAASRAPLAQLRAQSLAHPASLVSSPSSPRGRRTMIAIR